MGFAHEFFDSETRLGASEDGVSVTSPKIRNGGRMAVSDDAEGSPSITHSTASHTQEKAAADDADGSQSGVLMLETAGIKRKALAPRGSVPDTQIEDNGWPATPLTRNKVTSD